MDIGRWRWPFGVLSGESQITATSRYNPWTVLLVQAFKLCGRII